MIAILIIGVNTNSFLINPIYAIEVSIGSLGIAISSIVYFFKIKNKNKQTGMWAEK